MRNKRNKLQKAFTITELVIVIAVIAILVAVFIPTFAYVVEDANRSAALQTCHHGLTEYVSTRAIDGEDSSGVVFVCDGYAFVFAEGNLHEVGKLDELTAIKSGERGFVYENKPADTQSVGEIALLETLPSSGKLTISGTALADNETLDLSQLLSEENKIHKTQNLYFYSIKVNEKTYNGYFTCETENDDALCVYSGALYSFHSFMTEGSLTISEQT